MDIGVDNSIGMDWVVHTSLTLLIDYKLATIKDVACTNMADKEDAAYVK